MNVVGWVCLDRFFLFEKRSGQFTLWTADKSSYSYFQVFMDDKYSMVASNKGIKNVVGDILLISFLLQNPSYVNWCTYILCMPVIFLFQCLALKNLCCLLSGVDGLLFYRTNYVFPYKKMYKYL